jgi:hypothetical protein
MKNWPDKDPDEVLDYAIDWSPRLVQPNGMTDQIDTSTWILPSGITQTSASISGQLAVVWLSGGSLGDTYTITNRIVTVGGRTMDQSVRLRIKAK